MIGLGRMGGSMARRLLNGGHRIVAFDPDENARKVAEGAGAVAATSVQDLVAKLSAPRAIPGFWPG